MKVLLIGGHISPLLAVFEELKKQGDIAVEFVSRRYTMEGDKTPSQESKILRNTGMPVHFINTGRLQRRISVYAFLSLLKVPVGFFQACRILAKSNPQVVVSFGSYVSVPIVFAAWLKHIPVITHEQSVHAGLANRINALFAKKVLVSWENSLRYFPSAKTIVTGNPLRNEIFQTKAQSMEIDQFLTQATLPLLYITGGNQGSHTINTAIFSALPQLVQSFTVLHQTGSASHGDLQKALDVKQTLPHELQSHYFPIDFIHKEDIGAIYSKTSLLIGRSGANTVSEIAAIGKPALFIPIPWAQHNEQEENARVLQEKKTALILPQKKLNDQTLIVAISEIFEQYDSFLTNAKQANTNEKSDVSQKIVAIIRQVAQVS